MTQPARRHGVWPRLLGERDKVLTWPSKKKEPGWC